MKELIWMRAVVNLSHRKTLLLQTAANLRRLSISRLLMKDDEHEKSVLKLNEEKEVEVKKTTKTAGNKEAFEKLDALLKSMIHDEPPSTKISKLVLSKPLSDKKVEKRKQQKEVRKEAKLLGLDENLLSATKAVARSLDVEDEKKIELELLKRLLSQSDDAADAKTQEKSISDIIHGMKIEKQEETAAESRAQQVKHHLARTSMSKGKFLQRRDRSEDVELQASQGVDLFGGTHLKIFDENLKVCESDLTTWNKVKNNELRRIVTHPPSNIWEQMILWTDQDKLWKFPINNEQGMNEEFGTYFTDHIFLEKHLEPWCPKKVQLDILWN